MRKSVSALILLMLCIVIGASADEKKFAMYAIGFYNQENLFDTCHDEGKKDYDFLPGGSYKWTGMKYSHKLHNMANALSEMGTDKLPYGCAFIGLAEVENAKCLTDLCAQEALKKRGMKFVHFEGVDKRGIDVAALYNPKQFNVDWQKTKLVPYDNSNDTTFYTRGFLVVHGTVAGEHVCCIVCHLPSRLRGDDSGRVWGAEQVTALKEQILKDDSKTKVFIMGDMNDDPVDRSMVKGLHGEEDKDDVDEGDMFNPWIETIKSGTGTLRYDGKWNLFDQILISPNLLVSSAKDEKDDKKYQKAVLSDCKTLRYFTHQIFRRDYLMQTEGKYKGNPKRTHAGGQWLDGYSDHLPVVLYIVKEK